jgi:hypothetical protein
MNESIGEQPDSMQPINPKSEARNPKEIRNPTSERLLFPDDFANRVPKADGRSDISSGLVRISDFFRISDFGLRICPNGPPGRSLLQP